MIHDYHAGMPPLQLRPAPTQSGPGVSLMNWGLKQIGSLRLLFGGMLAHAPFFIASSLIQLAS
jgi:hypothetical protein